MNSIHYFDRIAPRYDLLNKVLSLGLDVWWRKELVSDVIKNRPQKVLDVCSGTGDVALSITTADPRVEVVACDASVPMLERAKVKAKKRKQERITFVRADALHLPFKNEEFDCVTMAFGLRNMPHYKDALSELQRVIKKGGHVAILEFSYPTNPFFSFFYSLYLRYYLPLIGRVFVEKEAYTYLANSIQLFSHTIDVEKLLTEIGFSEVTTHTLSCGITKIYSGKK